MAELTRQQRRDLKEDLLRLKAELERMLSMTEQGARPVDLDEPISRLTRMDALQQQNMVKAGRRTGEQRLRQVKAALDDIEEGWYGNCRSCDEPIGYPRLKARPDTPFCLGCQGSFESRR